MNVFSITQRLLLLSSILVFGLSAKPISLFAQGPTDPLSLAEAIAWGVDNNLNVAGQRLNVEVATRNDNWVSAGRAPVVQATLGINNGLTAQNNPASFINGSFYSGNATAGLSANYTLFNGYRVRYAKRQLGQNVQVANQQVKQLVETSVFDVASAYYTAQLEQARVRVNEKVFKLNQDRVAYQELRKQYGQGQSVELLQARSALLTDSIRIEQSRVTYDNALRSLYLALDAEPETFAGRNLADTLVFTPSDWDIARIERRIDSSAAIQLLKTQEQLALTNTEIARTAMKPSITLNGGLNFTENAFKFNGEDPRSGEPAELIFGNTSGANVGVQAAYTLWDAGARRRSIDNAIVQERVANISVRNAKREANVQARSLLATYRNQRQLLALQDLLIETAGANLALSEEQLRAGTINSFDYRTVQLEYVNAELSRLQSVYNILLTDLNLRRLTGTLVE